MLFKSPCPYSYPSLLRFSNYVCCPPCFYGKSNRPKIIKYNLYKSKGNVNAKSHFKTFLTRNSPFISQINYNLCLNQEELNLQFKNPRSLDLTSFPY